jgi:hypothetical protein
MFDRFNEKARRVIFFARYEAGESGSTSIDPEHILLGLLREDPALMQRFHLDVSPEIRDYIEKAMQRGTRVATSAEIPLSADCRKLLQFACEEADRLAHREVATSHLLLGILHVHKSSAANLLASKGAKLDALRLQIAQGIPSVDDTTRRTAASPTSSIQLNADTSGASTALDQFLELLKTGASDQLADFFHEQGQFVDSSGKRWFGRAEMGKAAEALVAPFAKRNTTFRIEGTTAGPSHSFVASVLWELAAASSNRSKSVLRMSIVMARADEEWAIVLLQVTPVTLS